MPRWRRDSIFGDGPRAPLDREQRAQWRGRLRWLYMLGKITAKTLLIGLAMADFLGADGRCDPSHASIGARAHAGARTVRRALAALSELGMLCWARRLVRDGSYVEQTSNSYVLLMPAPERLGDGHSGRATHKNDSYSLPPTVTDATTIALNKTLAGLTAAGLAALKAIRTKRAGALGLLA